MKKVMVLGASYTQTPLYEAARRLEISAVAASIPGDYPGFALADACAYVDIGDPDAVEAAAKKAGIDGIVTCGLDLGMRAMGQTCEALGLPGPSRKAASRAGDKWKMKLALREAKVATAPFFCIRNEEELEAAMGQLTFPVVLKATDLMGGRGIFRADSPEEARAAYPRVMEATARPYCLIEEFIKGEMFGVEGMVQNGEVCFLLPNNTENALGGEVPTPVGHSVPYLYEETLGEKIRQTALAAIRALGLDNCPVNLDLIRRGEEVYVIELTGRSGATGLSELVGARYGLDYYEVLLKACLGEPVGALFQEKKDAPAVLTHTLSTRRTGVVRQIRTFYPKTEGLLDFSFNIRPGDAVRPYTNGRDRIGQIFLTGKDLQACEQKLRRLKDGFTLELEGDLPVTETPIQRLGDYLGNRIYVKREDLQPFSFGGNKLRFAAAYLEDFDREGATAMILYGGYSSNLCRILAAACSRRGIPCAMVYNIKDTDQEKETFNRQLICEFSVRPYPCTSDRIAETVDRAVKEFEQEGERPYYIHGDIHGRGRAHLPMEAYEKVYQEILHQEETLGVTFDYIALASSTNATQSGLLIAHLLAGDGRKILGISVNRSQQRACEVIRQNLKDYEAHTGLSLPPLPEEELLVAEEGLLGGYGCTDEALLACIREAYRAEGLPLDPVYTGKGYYGMREYLRKKCLTGKNILFLHTGGSPMFFDYLNDSRS